MARTVADALRQALDAVASLAAEARSFNGRAALHAIDLRDLLRLYDTLQTSYVRSQPFMGLADPQAAAAANMINPPVDLLALFTAAHQAGAACATWIEDALPTDDDGWVLAFRVDAQAAAVTWATLSVQDLAPLRALLDDLIAALAPLE